MSADRPRPWLVLTVSAMAVFLVFLDMTVLARA
jgi:hypothetical protein